MGVYYRHKGKVSKVVEYFVDAMSEILINDDRVVTELVNKHVMADVY